ncbi:MAG: hypothetical protein VYA80_00745 [Pseudomonadota bacterium]|nr:hypothetical protein [Pseudomonadota bacterium]
MSDLLRATAPGKLILFGEYAVLHGGPALATSVGVKAIAEIRPSMSNFDEIYIQNSNSLIKFRITQDGNLDWHTEPSKDTLIFSSLFSLLHERNIWDIPKNSTRIVLDSRDFFTLDKKKNLQKLGLGSSAGICVALTGAIYKLIDIKPEFETMIAAHQRFQKEKGSGIDVACSFNGGVISYSIDSQNSATVKELTWPKDLHVLPIWSGLSSSTTKLLARLYAFKNQNRYDYERYIEDLSAASSYSVSQWEIGKTDMILKAIKNFSKSLKSLDNVAKIGIWSDVHQSLEKIANKFGAIYKPSGSGGGDFGLAFTNDKSKLKRLSKAYIDEGFKLPKLELSVKGLQVEES